LELVDDEGNTITDDDGIALEKKIQVMSALKRNPG